MNKTYEDVLKAIKCDSFDYAYRQQWKIDHPRASLLLLRDNSDCQTLTTNYSGELKFKLSKEDIEATDWVIVTIKLIMMTFKEAMEIVSDCGGCVARFNDAHNDVVPCTSIIYPYSHEITVSINGIVANDWVEVTKRGKVLYCRLSKFLHRRYSGLLN